MLGLGRCVRACEWQVGLHGAAEFAGDAGAGAVAVAVTSAGAGARRVGMAVAKGEVGDTGGTRQESRGRTCSDATKVGERR
jgi:hypothetical protein